MELCGYCGTGTGEMPLLFSRVSILEKRAFFAICILCRGQGIVWVE